MNKQWLGLIVTATMMASSSAMASIHFYTAEGETIIPDSSIPRPGRAHTNLIINKPVKKIGAGIHASLPDGETPASIACVYGLTTKVSGCKKSTASELVSGGWGTIALVDAYYNPDVESDLNTFSAEFGLPACTTANGCFQVVYATSGGLPPAQQGWWNEQVLDVEWAHAMAPNAKIILVEAETSSTEDLFIAEEEARDLVGLTGGLVSNSWGTSETANEASNDSLFVKPGVVFLASTGDSSAPSGYPAVSPNVIAAGGTTIIRDSSGNFTGETAWSTKPGSSSGGAGGPSVYEPRPAYQNLVQKIVGTQRGTPDISFDANPESGVLVYSTHEGGWFVDGGTSVSSPALSGLINVANRRANSTVSELSYIYDTYIKNANTYWTDIIEGNNGYPAMRGYDFATGLGSPIGYQGK